MRTISFSALEEAFFCLTRTKPLLICLQKIEHAGYTRYILHRNPPRYDSEGDEIEGEAEEDADSETAAEANEDNPFAGIALERMSYPSF